jgi:hypothetical protein
VQKKMSRGSVGIYASLASALDQADRTVIDSASTRGERSAPINMTVLPTTILNEAPSDPIRPSSSSRPQRSSPLLNSVSSPDDLPGSYSLDGKKRDFLKQQGSLLTFQQGSTQAQVPSRSHSQEPFVPGNLYPSLHLDLSDEQRRSLQPEFNSKIQFWKLFWRGSKRFAITLTLVVLFMVTIKVFSNHKVMSRKKKLWFNAIITGLSMTLGMSIAEAFKCMAVDIRWWILSRKKRSLDEVSYPSQRYSD